jgi:hypothetical protein
LGEWAKRHRARKPAFSLNSNSNPIVLDKRGFTIPENCPVMV